MTVTTMRPGADEYSPYYERYVSKVPDGEITTVLAQQIEATLELLRGIPESKGSHRYEPGKWTLRESIGHVIDSERIFSCRALRIARGDTTPLPGFEQDDYVPTSGAERRTIGDLADELEHVRRATLDLYRHLDDEALARRGTASGATITPRALAYIIAGHERHHVMILRERYL